MPEATGETWAVMEPAVGEPGYEGDGPVVVLGGPAAGTVGMGGSPYGGSVEEDIESGSTKSDTTPGAFVPGGGPAEGSISSELEEEDAGWPPLWTVIYPVDDPEMDSEPTYVGSGAADSYDTRGSGFDAVADDDDTSTNLSMQEGSTPGMRALGGSLPGVS